jgi:hypothetical protein
MTPIVDEAHRLTWDWTTKTMNELGEIAKYARAAMKTAFDPRPAHFLAWASGVCQLSGTNGCLADQSAAKFWRRAPFQQDWVSPV